MKIKNGNWSYDSKKLTITYHKKNHYQYDVDLEKSCVLDWIEQTSQKAQIWTREDINDLIKTFEQVKEINPDLPVYKNTGRTNQQMINRNLIWMDESWSKKGELK